MKISCLIVDDEPVARKIVEEFVRKVPFLELKGEAADAQAAEQLLDKHEVKLMFLDIQMPKITGINFLRSRKEHPLTIITTAYPNYAVEGFELDILDYLIKPIAFERFLKACTKAQHYLEMLAGGEAGGDYFFVKCGNRIERIDYQDLNFAEAMENYVVLHTREGKKITYLTLKGLLEHLPGNIFLKVHKSFVVNTSKVKSIEGNELILDQGKIPVAQALRNEVVKTIVGGKMINRNAE